MKSATIMAVVAALAVVSASAFATTVGYNSTSVPSGTTGVFSPTFDNVADSGTIGTSGGTLTAAPTTTTLTDGGSTWNTDFATSASPYLVKMTSGSAVGRFFNITSNTGTVLTVEGDPLTAGVANGDSYQIVQGHTLASFFANTSVLGGTSSTTASADAIFLYVSGSWINYYYDTDNNQFQRVGFSASADNIAISPTSAILYLNRDSTATTIVNSGTVAETSFAAPIGTGTNWVSSGYPTDQTLADTGLESTTNWISSSSDDATGADRVFIYLGGSWVQYFFNSTAGEWRRVGFTSNAGTTNIPAGTPFLIIKGGSAGVYTRASAL
jgi:uncharacterized protein (TIGR02597 family)